MATKLPVLVFRPAFVGVGAEDVGVGLAPNVVLDRVADEYGREVGQRKIVFGDALQRNGVGLREEEGVVAVDVFGLGVRQPHRYSRRHLEDRVADRPFAHHAAVLLRLDVVVDVTGMYGVALARVGDRHGDVLILGTRPFVESPRAARLVVDAETGRGRDVLCVADLEIGLAVAFLSRFDVGHLQEGTFAVVERRVPHVVNIGVERGGETEILPLGPLEIVERNRSLAERADRRITHAVAVEGVVDSPRRERGVERFDPHAVVILGDVPFEVGQRPDRIAEKVGFERFFDALLLGRVDGLLRLPLLVFGRGVRYSVEVGVFAALLGAHERTGVELGTDTPRQQRRQEQHCREQICSEPFRHAFSLLRLRPPCALAGATGRARLRHRERKSQELRMRRA